MFMPLPDFNPTYMADDTAALLILYFPGQCYNMCDTAPRNTLPCSKWLFAIEGVKLRRH